MRPNSLPRFRWLLVAISLVAACSPRAGGVAPVNAQTSGQDVPIPTMSLPPAVYPLAISGNGQYLVDQNGQPFFIDGDAAWSLIAQLSDGDKDTYLANRQAHGVNMVIVNLIEHLYATNAPKDVYGNAPFTGKTFTTPNDAYFQHGLRDQRRGVEGDRGAVGPAVSGVEL